MKRAFVLLRQAGCGIDESALTLLTSTTAIADEVIAVLLWHDNSYQCPTSSLRGRCHEAWIVRGEGLRHADGSVLGRALAAVLPPRPVLLMHHDSFAMDTGPGASIILNVPFASNVVSLEHADDGVTRLGRKEYGGQVQALYELNQLLGCLITVSATLRCAGKLVSQEPRIVERNVPAPSPRRRWLRNERANFTDDVDITTVERLVAIGRGMQEPEHIALAEAAARAMAGVVCCSRPVVDAGKLGKSRQVGISGMSVSPRIYLACGISGSFQHMAGLQGSSFIIAINKNAQAPIFERAQVGIVADAAEFLSRLVPILANNQK